MSALTCFADPLEVSVELSLNLLLSPQLQELAPVFHSLSLFGKFTVGRFVERSIWLCSLSLQTECAQSRRPPVCADRQRSIPREDTQHQVEHEEGADDDERDVVHPVPGAALHVVALREADTLITDHTAQF